MVGLVVKVGTGGKVLVNEGLSELEVEALFVSKGDEDLGVRTVNFPFTVIGSSTVSTDLGFFRLGSVVGSVILSTECISTSVVDWVETTAKSELTTTGSLTRAV